MSKVVNSDEEPVFTQPVSDLCRDFIRCCMKRKSEERLNVYKLIRHPFLNSHKDTLRKIKTEKDPLDLFFEDSTPTKNSEEPSLNQDLDGSLKRAATEALRTKDFKQITSKYRQPNLRLPNKNQEETSKGFTFETPFIIDSQGREKMFTIPADSLSKQFSEQVIVSKNKHSFGNDKLTGSKSERSGPFMMKKGCDSNGQDKRTLRIPIVRQGNTSMESNNPESSRNLAINIKNKGLTLKFKADTTFGTKKPTVNMKPKHDERSKDEYSDFEFDDENEPDEVIHEFKITIKEKCKLVRPIARKPLKSQRQNNNEKAVYSIYEPKEVDLLDNTPTREFIEVPNLVLGPVESGANKDLRSAFAVSGSTLTKPARPYTSPEDFLLLDINPSH